MLYATDRARRCRCRLAFLLLAPALACGGDPTATGDDEVVTVEITPTTATLFALGAVQQFTAVAKNGAGDPVPSALIAWNTDNPSVATVDADGLATAMGHGSTTIRAAATNSLRVTAVARLSVQTDNGPINWRGATLLSVWGASPNDVFAVGPGVIVHFDGVSWRGQQHPGGGARLRGVWGSSGTDVYAVGHEAAPVGIILHFNGGTWKTVFSRDRTEFRGIWGSSASQIYAVGQTAITLTPVSFMARFDGQNWGGLMPPFGGGLNAAWGTSPTNVFVVGDSGDILHFDGAATWVLQRDGSYPNHLYGVWGSGPTDVYAVGVEGLFHYDGVEWSGQLTGTRLFGVWGASATDVFAVGPEGLILHYDGVAWTEQTSGTSQDLYAVTGWSGSDVVAVGASGTILQYDGVAWNAL